MPSRVPIDGQVLAELREDRFWSQELLAEQARAFAKSQGESCALSRSQVIGYEAARLKDPRSRYPSRENLCYVVGALRPAMADLGRLLGREPPSVLAQWASDAVNPPSEEAETAAPTAKEPSADRREFAIKLPAAVAAHVARSNPADPLRAEIDALTADYAKPPQQLLSRARRLLDKIMRVMREPMLDGVRRRLLVDASEVAALAGLMALFADRPGEADAYFTQGLKFAAASGVDRALGCALASAAMVPGVGIGDDHATALAMLQAAERLLPAQGLMTKVVVLRQAEELGAFSREHWREGFRVLERGGGIAATDDGEGLYARRAHLSYATEASITSWAGRIEVRLGRTDEGLAKLGQWNHEPVVNLRTPAVKLGDVALGHTAAGDPEPACDAAVRALDASQAAGYRLGVDRVRRVRNVMPPEWAPLACVRELDERLRSLA